MRYFLIVTFFCLIACNSTSRRDAFFEDIKDENAKALLQEVIANSGGIEKWKSIG